MLADGHSGVTDSSPSCLSVECTILQNCLCEFQRENGHAAKQCVITKTKYFLMFCLYFLHPIAGKGVRSSQNDCALSKWDTNLNNK